MIIIVILTILIIDIGRKMMTTPQVKICSFIIFICICAIGCVTTSSTEWSCKSVVPPDFEEMDVVGTWQANINLDNDTIIIRDDGYYRQILHNESELLDYESEWQKWWIVYGESGIPYLYLENMMLCVYAPLKSCQISEKGSWFDYCTGKTIETSGEGILVVIYNSYSAGTPQTLHLGALLIDPDVSGTHYELISP